MYAQAYFDYDSKKSGGVTMSHLRFGKKPIKSTYLIHKANFVACHNPSYVNKYHMVEELVDGGTFLLNCPWDEAGLEEHLPGQVKAFIANHNIKFYVIDGVKIGIETGMGPTRINTILQSAFFKLAKIIPEEKAIELMKAAAPACIRICRLRRRNNSVRHIRIRETWYRRKRTCMESGKLYPV